MDVLRPQIIRIAGRCYRKNPTEIEQSDAYVEEEYSNIEYDEYADEVCDAGFTPIEQTETGYRLAFDVPSAYFKFIIGKKGETKKRLENDTRTHIVIPKQGQEGQIVIQGRDRSGVMSAKSRLDIMIESARQRQPFTHFLSFPIVGDEVQAKFREFKEDVLRFCDGDRGIDSSIFQNPHKLHMTLGTLALLSDKEIEKAEDILKECYNDIVDPLLHGMPLAVHIQGLEYMNDDPAEVDVLYAQVHDPSDRLQQLSDELVNKFTSEGLMQRDYDRVKLHITLINTLFRKDPSGAEGGVFTKSSAPGGGGGGGGNNRESFDATNVLKNYGDYEFSQYEINTVHLSQRYSTGAGGYYDHAAKIDFT